MNANDLAIKLSETLASLKKESCFVLAPEVRDNVDFWRGFEVAEKAVKEALSSSVTN